MDLAHGTALPGVLERATAILRPVLGDGVTLHAPTLLRAASRSLVVRARVRGATTAAPSSVVIKRGQSDPARGFDEWASLRFLGARYETARLVPRVIGADIESRTFVMEDLGDGFTLHELLASGDAAAPTRALLTLAERTAELHADTLGQEAEFARIRNALPMAAASGRRPEIDGWRRRLPRAEHWFVATGVPLPRGRCASLERVARAYAEPGPFLAFTHGDPAPTNNHIRDDAVHLLDFEYGAFRHALYDLTAWHLLCPLPPELVEAMSARYRARLAPACPAASDDAAYAAAWAAMTTYRAIWRLAAIDPNILVEDHCHVDEWTAREAVFVTVSRLARTAIDVPELAPVAEAAEGLTRALHARWGYPAEPLPRWPAFARGDTS